MFLDVNIKGNQRVRLIAKSGEFIANIDNFFNKKPSSWTMRKLKSTKLYFIERKDLVKIRKNFSNLTEVSTPDISQRLINWQNRVGDLMTLDVEKYNCKLLSVHKDIVLSVAQQELASYLGITAKPK